MRCWFSLSAIMVSLENRKHAIMGCFAVIDLPLSAEIFKMFEKMRLKVIEEMQDYYKNDMRLNDFSERLGNLLIVSHGAGVSFTLFF